MGCDSSQPPPGPGSLGTPCPPPAPPGSVWVPWGLGDLMGQIQLAAWKQRQVTHRSRHHSHGGGLRRGGPRPHLLLCKELRSPQCTVRLSAILLTLSGSQSVPPTPVSSVPGPCPSWAGQRGGESARTRAGGQLGPGPQRTEVQPLTVPPAGQAAHSKKPRLSRQYPLCGHPGCQQGLILV